ncbi:hypothetical protein BCR43DRAFT_528394 [Syncephalastrum racemosum]|uniref:Uncharacterized protein n=1 Tax=Syncephalastrum racemosum TaxID=13706 RepID=A0A1X2GZ62_SYNRA|nr:hypothetical protein BCR43DRAFT_528394 [Syncephalastrum racemosum]
MPSAAAVSALSLKRNQSASTTHTRLSHPTASATRSGSSQPQTKLSKLNALFTKITRSFSQLSSPPSPLSTHTQSSFFFFFSSSSSASSSSRHRSHRRNLQTHKGWRWSHYHFERRPIFFSSRIQATNDEDFHDTEFEHSHYKNHSHLSNNEAQFDNALTAPVSPPAPILCVTPSGPWTELKQRGSYHGILVENENLRPPTSASDISVHTTRRHLRHTFHVSSSNTTNIDTEDDCMYTVSTRSTQHPHTLSHMSHGYSSQRLHQPMPGSRPHAFIMNCSSLHSQDAYSTYSSACRKQGPQIWDQEFWRRPGTFGRLNNDPATPQEPHTRHPLQPKSDDPLHQHTTSRGRFEIHLEKGNSNQQNGPSTAPAELESSIPLLPS